ncbi:MAG TPA: PQQ-dependent sugar dehydrogenase, partial [Candidatus Poseidoniia archaeon]|nr:PQQ-dependent sugar dehydrogenase [Candidatus Poseidoniia archaeon]
SREINAAIPITIFLLISVTFYGFYDNLSGEDEGTDLDLIDPVWDYEHDSESGYGSVTGGFVYRGENAPGLYGKYIYADFIMGRIWALEVTDDEKINTLIHDSKANTSLTGNSRISVSSFGESEDGELYFSDRSTGRIFGFNEGNNGDIVIEEYNSDISIEQLIGIYNAGDSSNRLFGIEQAGRIHAIEQDKNTTVLLDITEKVENTDWEQGLLGMAFHPDYETNNRLFVTYTVKNLGADAATLRLSKFVGNNETILLDIEQPYVNHNGGHIVFGPEGYLYVGLGDGGKYNDAFNHAQNLKTFKGSILKLDVDGDTYVIPSDNPFIGNSDGYKEEIFAYGFRNPWMFSFDRETGDLWVGDVGQDKWEEIDVVVSGGNYGWAYREGKQCFDSPFEHYDGHSCGEIDSWTFGAFIYERVLLNIPLMAILLLSMGVSTRYKIKIG